MTEGLEADDRHSSLTGNDAFKFCVCVFCCNCTYVSIVPTVDGPGTGRGEHIFYCC